VRFHLVVRITEADKAVLSLKTQRRKLTAYQAQLEASMCRDTETAKQLLASGRRDRALLALRKRASTQQVLARVDGWLLKVEQTLCSLDSAARTQALVAAMRSGADVLKEISAACTLADVDALLDDTAEGVEAAQKLQSALAGGNAMTEEADAEAQHELNMLEEQMTAAAAVVVPPRGQDVGTGSATIEVEEAMPAVPTARVHIPVAASVEEQALPA
jgi:charged multivesicular body protein 6